MNLLKCVKRNLGKFRSNRSGVVWVWVAGVATLILFPFIYWGLSKALDTTATLILANYTLTGSTLSGWVLAKAIISALPLIVTFVVALWVLVNSKAKAYEGA